MKGVFDGVICALQNHTEPTIPPEVVERIAECLPPQDEREDEERDGLEQEIEMLLRDPRSAVLGGVARLVSPYRSGVKWGPSDTICA